MASPVLFASCTGLQPIMQRHRLQSRQASGPLRTWQPAVAARRHRSLPPVPASSSAAMPSPDSSSGNGAEPFGTGNGAGAPAADVAAAGQQAGSGGGLFGWLRAQQRKTAELRAKVATLGLAAVLSYGLLDAVTYTSFFVAAWLGYEARTGLNPTQNVGDIIKIVLLMWAGNNVTRPFRVGGAAAIAPFMDKLMDRMQAKLKLRSKSEAFALIVSAAVLVCGCVVGALFVTRWVSC